MQQVLIISARKRLDFLARLTSLLRRLRYEVEALSVCFEPISDITQITLTVKKDGGSPHLLLAHLNNLIDVVEVKDMSDKPIFIHNLAFIKVRVSSKQKVDLKHLANGFHTRFIEETSSTIIIEIAGTASEIEQYKAQLGSAEILETVWTGPVAMLPGFA
ncbi:MAG: acetolactate synthase small subunit [Chloroflexi bacterium]|nr:MAG: acetolactate synthase small subunit [Chloroflexota bacterium]